MPGTRCDASRARDSLSAGHARIGGGKLTATFSIVQALFSSALYAWRMVSRRLRQHITSRLIGWCVWGILLALPLTILLAMCAPRITQPLRIRRMPIPSGAPPPALPWLRQPPSHAPPV